MKSIFANSTQSEPTNLYVKHWYAIYVRSRQEKKVHQILLKKGVESSLPVIKTIRRWSDRKKKIEIPLFRGYVFVNIDIQNEKLDVLQTDGVARFVTFGGKTVTIPEPQMYWLDRLITTSNIEHEEEFPVGTDVEVIYGLFKGLRGKVKHKHSETRIVVWFDAIMQGVSLKINPTDLKKIKQKKKLSSMCHSLTNKSVIQ